MMKVFQLSFLTLFFMSSLVFASGDAAKGKEKFDQLCATCHGATGKGDGVAAQALNPKPRNLSDPTFQKEKTDEHLVKIIKEGGVASGLSAAMPAWGSMLTDTDMVNLIAYIRSFK